MVNIYIRDSGLLSIPYDATETPFTDYTSATQNEKRAGEFRQDDTSVLLKVDSLVNSVANTSQDVLGITDMRGGTKKIALNPFTFTLTCHIIKPTTLNTTNRKDLPELIKVLLMTLTKGYKQLWIVDTETNREQNMSLYDYISTFGYNDSSLAVGTTVGAVKKHLKIDIQSFTQNEGNKSLTYQLQLRILWDME